MTDLLTTMDELFLNMPCLTLYRRSADRFI